MLKFVTKIEVKIIYSLLNVPGIFEVWGCPRHIWNWGSFIFAIRGSKTESRIRI